MLNFRGLEALCAFVQTGSVAKAAERLGRTPPQVGRLLSSLESELEFAIFDRRTRPLELTREGRNFALQANAALSGIERLDKVARQFRAADRTHLRVLTAPFLGSAIVIDALAALSEKHPEMTVELDSRIRLDIEEWIEKESFDLGIASLPVQHSAFRTEPLIDVQVVCVMRADNPLASVDVVDFDMLSHEALVLQHPRSQVRIFLERLSDQRRLPLNVKYEAPNGLIAAQMVARGLGCGIADPFIASSLRDPDLVLKRFRPTLTLQYGFLTPNWLREAPLLNQLKLEIRHVAQQRWNQLGKELGCESL